MKQSPIRDESSSIALSPTSKKLPETPVGLEFDQNQDRDDDRKEALLESVPESERWNPVPGSTGVESPTNSSVDEDVDGRSVHEQLVEEGAADAAVDSRKQSSKSDD
jgi:hypothetical protein